LAEGSARFSKVEKKRFYEISRSSLVEVDTQIEISLVLNYLQKNEIENLEAYVESVFKMLSKMISNLQT
jgi:four helix bundle protein